MKESQINRPIKTYLHTFNGAEVKPLGVIALQVYGVDRMIEVKFLVVDIPSAMNVIIGRKWIYAIKGVVSTLHQVMRCQSPDGLYTIDIKGNQSQSRRCSNIEIREEEHRRVRRMTKSQTEKFDNVKDAEEEILEDESDK